MVKISKSASTVNLVCSYIRTLTKSSKVHKILVDINTPTYIQRFLCNCMCSCNRIYIVTLNYTLKFQSSCITCSKQGRVTLCNLFVKLVEVMKVILCCRIYKCIKCWYRKFVPEKSMWPTANKLWPTQIN